MSQVPAPLVSAPRSFVHKLGKSKSRSYSYGERQWSRSSDWLSRISRQVGPLTRITFAEPRKVLPILRTDEPVCPEGKLSCGNGECVDKELFCNGKPDCKDESDENACSKCRFNRFAIAIRASFGHKCG